MTKELAQAAGRRKQFPGFRLCGGSCAQTPGLSKALYQPAANLFWWTARCV
jgi:hypothetical protein